MKCSERQFFVWVNERDRSSFWTSRISVRWASIELCYVNFSLNLFVNFVFVFQKFLEVFGDLDTVCSLIQDGCPESNSIRCEDSVISNLSVLDGSLTCTLHICFICFARLNNLYTSFSSVISGYTSFHFLCTGRNWTGENKRLNY